MTIRNFTSVAVLMILNCCLGQQKESFIDSQINLESNIKKLIIENFNKFDVPYLRAADSCLFNQYILKDYHPFNQRVYQRLNDFEIFSETCPYTIFSFAILKADTETEYFYYGLADIYHLKYSRDLANGQVVEFKNEPLNTLINKLNICDPSLNKRDNELRLRKFIYYLYREKHDNLIKPTFTERIGFGSVWDEIKKLEPTLSRSDASDFITFEEQHLGSIAFRISYAGNVVSIREFLIKSKVKTFFYKPEFIPDDYRRICN